MPSSVTWMPPSNPTLDTPSSPSSNATTPHAAGSHRATTANDNGAHTIKGLTPRFTGATQTTTPITANKTYEVQNIDRRNTLRNTSATDRHRHAATYASTNQLGPYEGTRPQPSMTVTTKPAAARTRSSTGGRFTPPS